MKPAAPVALRSTSDGCTPCFRELEVVRDVEDRSQLAASVIVLLYERQDLFDWRLVRDDRRVVDALAEHRMA